MKTSTKSVGSIKPFKSAASIIFLTQSSVGIPIIELWFLLHLTIILNNYSSISRVPGFTLSMIEAMISDDAASVSRSVPSQSQMTQRGDFIMEDDCV